jgi:hypothetical protein
MQSPTSIVFIQPAARTHKYVAPKGLVDQKVASELANIVIANGRKSFARSSPQDQ